MKIGGTEYRAFVRDFKFQFESHNGKSDKEKEQDLSLLEVDFCKDETRVSNCKILLLYLSIRY